MKPKVTIEYSRTDADISSERLAEDSAIDGKWAAFTDGEATTSGSVNDIAIDADAQRSHDRQEFADKLAANGWPNGMIERVVDRHYPAK